MQTESEGRITFGVKLPSDFMENDIDSIIVVGFIASVNTSVDTCARLREKEGNYEEESNYRQCVKVRHTLLAALPVILSSANALRYGSYS